MSIDYANMSDEEIRNYVPTVTEEEKPGDSFEDLVEEEAGNKEDEQSESDAVTEASDEDGNEADDSNVDDDTVVTETNDGDQDTVNKESDEDQHSDMERLFQPFKAGGREFSVKNVDEAISLMQKGVGYSKKMETIKGKLSIVKMLENNNLLDQDKLSFLIDLQAKKPEAIAKFIKDSGIDPFEIDVDKAEEYKKTSYDVDPRQLELDNVLDDLQSTPSYDKLLDTVANTWDPQSREFIYSNPQVLNVISTHMENGVYDIINEAYEREKVLGNINGMTNLDAYKTIGDRLEAEGAFNHLFNKKPSNKIEEAAARINKQAKKPTTEKAVVDKRKTAGVPKGKGADVNNTNVDMSKLSDKEVQEYLRQAMNN